MPSIGYKEEFQERELWGQEYGNVVYMFNALNQGGKHSMWKSCVEAYIKKHLFHYQSLSENFRGEGHVVYTNNTVLLFCWITTV